MTFFVNRFIILNKSNNSSILFKHLSLLPRCEVRNILAFMGVDSKKCSFNIDFENETIWIRETLQQSTKEISGDSNYTSSTKTESSNRTLPMIPQVKKILLEQRERQMRNKEFLKDAYISNDYVCTFDNGKEITPNYLTKKFHTLIEKQNDFPQIRFHDLRHSVASNLLNDGFTTVQVAEWLGHSSSTTTLKFYAHIDKTSKLAIANSLKAD